MSNPSSLRRSIYRGALVGLAVGCNGSQLGPCSVSFDDALVQISSARDAATNAAIPSLLVRNIKFNGTSLASLDQVLQGGPTPGISIRGSDLQCDIACGFATKEGTYNFVVARVGYRDTTVSVSGRYRQVSAATNGCPTRLSGGVAVGVILQSQ